MAFIYFIFIIFLTIILIGFILAAKVIRTILGLGHRMAGNSSKQKKKETENTSGYPPQANKEDRRKIFGKDEGEYIDFEEIKE